ncbi:hypothetical protein HPP92_005985 [Vanilla planifolia]|uniref:MACPF domain-containing protein n=1 Tax=Vanilla planifolia TaxID=51239 RepID=A0A835RMQ6_VANPL|nr:hypothetical protein HPP92_005985 [Vanilla planifolia]
MEEKQSEPVELRALRSLGMGFDLSSDFRLRFVKGYPNRRLVELDEENTGDLVFPSGFTVRRVSRDIGCDKGDRIRFCSEVLEFNEMSELLNQKSLIQGKVPSGYFNALFDLSGAWLDDAKETRNLALNGYFVYLYSLHLKSSPWFCVMKLNGLFHPTGNLLNYQELKVHLEDLGDYLFSGERSISPLNHKTRGGRDKVPEVFYKILQSNNLLLTSHSESSSKDGLTLICSKRGGDPYVCSHSKWLQTVPDHPDAIQFKFIPITSLLAGIPGNGYLSHAINLYLRYKPDPGELQSFLEFQVPRQWAPLYSELSLGPQHHQQRKSYPSLRFRLFGPKLLVNTTQVSSNCKPIVGLRLYLEGRKCNELSIHAQHLKPPGMLSSSSSSRLSLWQSSEESGPGFTEPILWKSYSRVCTAAVKHNPKWFEMVSDGVFIVTGAQLVTKGAWLNKCLHLRLLFTHFPNCAVQKTEWTQAPSSSRKGSFLATISTTLSSTFTRRQFPSVQRYEPVVLDSGVFPDAPPVQVQSQKLLRFVDMSEVTRGANNVPGHWLVTAAKLIKERGKVGLHVKFALLNYSVNNERIKV